MNITCNTHQLYVESMFYQILNVKVCFETEHILMSFLKLMSSCPENNNHLRKLFFHFILKTMRANGYA